jgi:hypothetical protein
MSMELIRAKYNQKLSAPIIFLLLLLKYQLLEYRQEFPRASEQGL